MDGRLTLEMGEGKEKNKWKLERGLKMKNGKLICHLCVETSQL